MALEKGKPWEQSKISLEESEILKLLRKAWITSSEQVRSLLELRERIVTKNIEEGRNFARLVIAWWPNWVCCS